MSHPRVVNCHHPGASWDVYVGRGLCPRTRQSRGLGNPYTVEEHGPRALLLYVDHVARLLRTSRAFRNTVESLRGRVLACWCAPRACHAEVLARLADGDALDAIRSEIVAALPPEQLVLFRGGARG